MDRLPPELWRGVLQQLSLPPLLLVKAVCQAMAGHVRAVVRSAAWQTRTPLNEFALREAIKTQVHSYKLPLTVSIYPELLPEDAQCLATIHRMKLLVRHATLSEMVHPVDPAQFEHDTFRDENTCLVPCDLCIEIRGEGIVASETALRQVLQSVLRTRGTYSAHKAAVADALWNYAEEPALGAAWPYRWRTNGEEVLTSFKDVLVSMKPATEIRAGKWIVNEAPWSGLECEKEALDLKTLCTMGLGLCL